MSRFVLRIDDISAGMAWDNLERLQAVLVETGVRPLVGVVPECRDSKLSVGPVVPDFWDRVRAMRDSGWAIAQHGFTHVYDTSDSGLVGSKGQSEFAGHTLDTQLARLKAGKSILEAQGCWQPIFMAPSHSMDLVTVRAMHQLGFAAVTDGYGLHPYRAHGLTWVPQMFARPVHVGYGIYTITLHLNGMSSTEVEAIGEFVRGRQGRFITFEEAVFLAQFEPRLAVPLRHLTAVIVPNVRRLRRRSLPGAHVHHSDGARASGRQVPSENQPPDLTAG